MAEFLQNIQMPGAVIVCCTLLCFMFTFNSFVIMVILWKALAMATDKITDVTVEKKIGVKVADSKNR